jgi:hypothetical protein
MIKGLLLWRRCFIDPSMKSRFNTRCFKLLMMFSSLIAPLLERWIHSEISLRNDLNMNDSGIIDRLNHLFEKTLYD